MLMQPVVARAVLAILAIAALLVPTSGAAAADSGMPDAAAAN
jgi:hypothetical protein